MQMKNIRIGIGQLNTRDDLNANVETIRRMVARCADEGADLVAFPECSTYLSSTGIELVAQYIDGEIITTFRDLAKKHRVFIHNGSFIEKNPAGEKSYNTTVLIDRAGEIVATYRKVHLFDMALDEKRTYQESSRYDRGEDIVVARTDIGDFGLSICYDLRFPELYRALTLNGARLVFVPAAFTLYTGKDHWEALLRARAIENQVFIVAPGQYGERPGGNLSYGNSMVIDPWGTVIARSSDRVDTVLADIKWDYQDQVRESLPSLKNRVEMDQLNRITIDWETGR